GRAHYTAPVRPRGHGEGAFTSVDIRDILLPGSLPHLQPLLVHFRAVEFLEGRNMDCRAVLFPLPESSPLSHGGASHEPSCLADSRRGGDAGDPARVRR